MKTSNATIKVVALIRDKDGVPLFEDINNIPEVFWQLLTEKEKEVIKDGRNSSRRNA